MSDISIVKTKEDEASKSLQVTVPVDRVRQAEDKAGMLRIAGGRELHLGSLQALGLYAANSIFVGDYLTTKGQPAEADYRMIEEMGFTVTRREEVPAGHS